MGGKDCVSSIDLPELHLVFIMCRECSFHCLLVLPCELLLVQSEVADKFVCECSAVACVFIIFGVWGVIVVFFVVVSSACIAYSPKLGAERPVSSI